MKFFLGLFLIALSALNIYLFLPCLINFKSENEEEKNHEKEIIKITINFKIKENLPIKKNYSPKKIIFQKNNQKKEKIFVFNILNKINWNKKRKYFYINYPLNLEIKDNFLFELIPFAKIIRFIKKEYVKKNDLTKIGINLEDSEKVINIFKKNIPYEETIIALKTIFLTRKRRFIEIIKKFIIF